MKVASSGGNCVHSDGQVLVIKNFGDGVRDL